MTAETWIQMGAAGLVIVVAVFAIWMWIRDYAAKLEAGGGDRKVRSKKRGARRAVAAGTAGAVSTAKAPDDPWDEDMPMSHIEEAFSINNMGPNSLRFGKHDDL